MTATYNVPLADPSLQLGSSVHRPRRGAHLHPCDDPKSRIGLTGCDSPLQTLGVITAISPTTEFEGFSFRIGNAGDVLGDCKLGDSIAVNGVCLTVTSWDAQEGWFEVGLANETLSRSNLGAPLGTRFPPFRTHADKDRHAGKLVVGSKVNLERAMAGHGRFGGHFVQVRRVAVRVLRRLLRQAL